MSPMLIGSCGVALLLLAFVLNLLRVVDEQSRSYLWMNFVGAGAACWYAWEWGLVPFIVLEGVWALTALVRLFWSQKNPRPAAGG